MTVIYQCLNAHYIFMNVFKEKRKSGTEGDREVEVEKLLR